MPLEVADAGPGAEVRRRLRRRQGLTLVLLMVGYAGYYLCRVNLSVATPLIADDLVSRGWTPGDARERIGAILSLGTLAYALGKFGAGALGDFAGGRSNFLGGMAGAVVFTALFALSGSVPIFTLAWMGNRLTQSLGFVGMVKIVGRWFDYRSTGAVMGFVSLSFLFGDAASRAFLAGLIDGGVGWRAIFLASAGTLAAWLAACAWLLRESPGEVGLPEGEANPLNVFGAEGQDPRPGNLRSLLGPLFRSRAFWYVCGLSLALTLLRETFNNWTPTYYADVVGLTKGRAAWYSSLFPLWGGVAVILAGIVGDRTGRSGRAVVIVVGLALTGLVLRGLGSLPTGVAPLWPIAGVTLVGFLLIGPYSYLAGALALDFGGKRGGATASGLIDGIGYLAGILAGSGVARLVQARGWSSTFTTLSSFTWASALLAVLYLVEVSRRPPAVE